MNHTIAQLQKMIAVRDARIVELRDQVARLQGKRRDHPLAMHVKCDECGAEAGERCVLPSGEPFVSRGRRSHHLRGRRDRCDNVRCVECSRAFGDHREITSPGSGT